MAMRSCHTPDELAASFQHSSSTGFVFTTPSLSDVAPAAREGGRSHVLDCEFVVNSLFLSFFGTLPSKRDPDDYETLRQIHEEYKTQQDRIKKENEEMNSKLLLVMSDKKELENQFDTTIRNLKTAIEQKQREIEEIQ